MCAAEYAYQYNLSHWAAEFKLPIHKHFNSQLDAFAFETRYLALYQVPLSSWARTAVLLASSSSLTHTVLYNDPTCIVYNDSMCECFSCCNIQTNVVAPTLPNDLAVPRCCLCVPSAQTSLWRGWSWVHHLCSFLLHSQFIYDINFLCRHHREGADPRHRPLAAVRAVCALWRWVGHLPLVAHTAFGCTQAICTSALRQCLRNWNGVAVLSTFASWQRKKLNWLMSSDSIYSQLKYQQ